MTEHVLIIDDDPVQRRLLKNAVERFGHIAHLADNGLTGLESLKRHGQDIKVIVLDLMMPEMNGLGFLAAIAEQGIDIPVIVETSQGGIETVVNAMRAGAFDFVVKPVSPERIGTAIGNALKFDRRGIRQKPAGKPATGKIVFDDIISASPAMVRVMELARRAAQSNIPVVLEGESGVGKEMVARAIQAASDRAGKPFITVNCGAIPHNLVESILFGHEKGAFTGATEKHSGKFVDADGGTLFLDEIGDLPVDVQVKLLRAVQHGEIETIGARRPQKVNVRLISATNKDLIAAVKNGEFREDLYYRLNVFPIVIPALRKRKEDIPVLARAFVERFSAEQKLAEIPQLSAAAMALLTGYDWPGNIRQLENTIFRAVVLANNPVLTVDDFPQIAAQLPGYFVAESGIAASQPASEMHEAGQDREAHRPPSAADLRGVYPDFSNSRSETFPGQRMLADFAEELREKAKENAISSVDKAGDVRTLADIEEELIRFALRHYHGQMSQVARKLGIGRSTLYRKLKDYGINPDDPLKEVA